MSEDEKPIYDYGLSNGSTVFVVARTLGGGKRARVMSVEDETILLHGVANLKMSKVDTTENHGLLTRSTELLKEMNQLNEVEAKRFIMDKLSKITNIEAVKSLGEVSFAGGATEANLMNVAVTLLPNLQEIDATISNFRR